MNPFRPLKPYKLQSWDDLKKVRNRPKLWNLQIKHDGYRCVILRGKAYSYSMKPIRNLHVKQTLEEWVKRHPDLLFIDGELMLNKKGATFQDVQSQISTREGAPDFRYIIYDCGLSISQPYLERASLRYGILNGGVIHVEQDIFTADVEGETEEALAAGHEGTILRHPEGVYKCGRSTLREGIILAFKKFVDAEARVIGFKPMFTNINELETNELGYAKRSHSKEGRFAIDTLGVLEVQGTNGEFEGKVFDIGTGLGLTMELRKEIWQNRNNYIGRILTYKYASVGNKDLPRQPIFKGFRDENDI
jgi:DNA ligase 1